MTGGKSNRKRTSVTRAPSAGDAGSPQHSPLRRSVASSLRRSVASSLPFVSALERWFIRHARALPWRAERTGYTALVAEAMLQQTQVARVLEHYDAFLRRFPDVRALAAAGEQEVLAAWQGLGYYRRAKSLHAAARLIERDFAGAVPSTVEELMRLPGVGRYTAGAIASLAFGAAEPIVDGNVQRVIARWDAIDDPPAAAATTRRVWERAEELVRLARRPGVFNEALMELGATVCTPRAPRCDACPAAAGCAARRLGRQEEIPPPRPRVTRTLVHHHAVLIRRGERILLERRSAAGLWSDLWQTPTIEATRRLRPAEIEARLPLRITGLRRLRSFEHQTTHRRVRFHVYEARSRARKGTWRKPDDVADLPMGSAQRRVVRGEGTKGQRD